MDQKDIEIFLNLTKTNNLTKTSENLFMTQSTVSSRLSLLNPGNTKNTIVIDSSVPLPKRNPSCFKTPWEVMKPRRKPTSVITLPDVRIDAVTAEIVSCTASFLGSSVWNSRYRLVVKIA